MSVHYLRPATPVTDPPAPRSDAAAAPRQHSLHRVPMFSGLSVDEFRHVERRVQEREFLTGQVIVRQGSAAHSMLVLTAGRAEVRRKDPASGLEFVIGEFEPSDHFGEMSLLLGATREASVYAVEPTRCAVLEQSDFHDVVRQNPEIAIALATSLAERLNRTAERAGMESIDLARVRLDASVIKLLPERLMLEHGIIPLRFKDNHLTLAMTNPDNVLAFDDVRRMIKGVVVEPVAISEDTFQKFMATGYRDTLADEPSAPSKPDAPLGNGLAFGVDQTEAEIDSLLHTELIRDLQLADDPEPESESQQDLMNASGEAPIIRLVNSLLGLAIQRDSSDIHVEPMEKGVTIRFRIDGQLQVVQNLPKRIQPGLVSRLKILSKLDIAEKRLPQDGRFSVTMRGRPIDIRVATLPGRWGEKVCLRILDKSQTTLILDKLVPHTPTLHQIRRLIHQPHGIVYVTGPTGSGKTTTLYAVLAELNKPGVNILTVEDPIEYDLAGVVQVQINREIGLDFSNILRRFLRQDPNIMLVGETRDEETARVAVEAALTGHLVLTTLHTNSAAGCFARLIEMGVEPFLLASSTIGIVAQRLVRRLCDGCKRSYTADDSTCEYLGLPQGSRVYGPVGCPACGDKGLKGRVGIFEVLEMNPELHALVAARSATQKIHACGLKYGMLELKQHAAILLLEGTTSVDEVLPVLGGAQE